MAEENARDIDRAGCWDRLRAHALGRLAYHLGDQVTIVPVNYAVRGERILFRTAPGSKLLGVVTNEDVAFEIDELGEDDAWSVVAHGRARLLDGAEALEAEDVLRVSWTGEQKHNIVGVDVTSVTGRQFRLSRPEPGPG